MQAKRSNEGKGGRIHATTTLINNSRSRLSGLGNTRREKWRVINLSHGDSAPRRTLFRCIKSTDFLICDQRIYILESKIDGAAGGF